MKKGLSLPLTCTPQELMTAQEPPWLWFTLPELGFPLLTDEYHRPIHPEIEKYMGRYVTTGAVSRRHTLGSWLWRAVHAGVGGRHAPRRQDTQLIVDKGLYARVRADDLLPQFVRTLPVQLTLIKPTTNGYIFSYRTHTFSHPPVFLIE